MQELLDDSACELVILQMLQYKFKRIYLRKT